MEYLKTQIDFQNETTLRKLRICYVRYQLCPRCVLRFLHDQVSLVCSDRVTEEQIEECFHSVLKPCCSGTEESKPEEEHVLPTTRNRICFACLGILQSSFLSKIVSNVVSIFNHIPASKVVDPSKPRPVLTVAPWVLDKVFKTSTSLVGISVFREYLVSHDIQCSLHGASGRMDHTGYIRLTTCFKPLFGNMIEKQFNAKFSPESALTVHVMFDLDHRARNFNKRKAKGGGPNTTDRLFELLDNKGSYNAVEAILEKFRNREDLKVVFESNDASMLTKATASKSIDFQVEVQADTIFLAGRYSKYSRTLSQTPWLVEDYSKITKDDGDNNSGEAKDDEQQPREQPPNKKARYDGGGQHRHEAEEEDEGESYRVDRSTSVEHLIVKSLSEYWGTDQIIFSSSGREDVDVRMLGSGRPCVLEIRNPRRHFEKEMKPEDLNLLEAQINEHAVGLISVNSFHFVSLEDVKKGRSEDSEKKKSYRCVVVLSQDVTDDQVAHLNALENLALNQITPIRVIHRRSLMNRIRRIYSIEATKITDRFLIVDVLAEAGTYIKEFVHGDLGRTTPSLGELIDRECDANIIQLDVLDVKQKPSL